VPKHASVEGAQMKVEQLMTRDVSACTADQTLNVPADIMWNHDCGAVPVVSADGNGRVVGIVTDRDLAMAAYTQGKPLWQVPVSVAMGSKVVTCKADDGLSRVQQLMRENRVRRLPVVDENGKLVGIVSLADIAREAERERSSPRKEVAAQDVGETLAAISRADGARQVAATA
jgi:CBS-domain-containing membrane protein